MNRRESPKTPNSAAQAAKKKRGRPSKYSEEIADAICERIANSELGLGAVAREFGLNRDTLTNWIESKPEFSAKYARAKDAQMDLMAEKIVDIADETSRDTKTIRHGDSETQVADNEWIQRSRLRVETRKWLMSKLAPKKYGDKVQQEISGKDGKPIEAAIHVTFVRPDNPAGEPTQ